ncbi:hypothetical protein E2C01_019037 [Portunus trituberculatus]|uniref:Uncharacterized protein n=1 Tax=Portunus trituberculatus TaxID=210409 RepID=A0A5B7DYR0_PORTR|nr:hypothetical protein [Portunus trituberculatus]
MNMKNNVMVLKDILRRNMNKILIDQNEYENESCY